jgi:hypothetical protein
MQKREEYVKVQGRLIEPGHTEGQAIVPRIERDGGYHSAGQLY